MKSKKSRTPPGGAVSETVPPHLDLFTQDVQLKHSARLFDGDNRHVGHIVVHWTRVDGVTFLGKITVTPATDQPGKHDDPFDANVSLVNLGMQGRHWEIRVQSLDSTQAHIIDETGKPVSTDDVPKYDLSKDNSWFLHMKRRRVTLRVLRIVGPIILSSHDNEPPGGNPSDSN